MKNVPQRKNIRLKDYDYSNAGYYFVTICTQGRKNLFGKIIDDKMLLSQSGKMIEKWVYELANKFSHIIIDKHVIMPNHIHVIIIIVGADLCVCPNKNMQIYKKQGGHIGPPLQQIIQWFKTMTTNEYIRGVKSKIYPFFDRRIWQRNYYDHIIRNEQEYQNIWEYIETNPLKWSDDCYYME